MPSNKLPQLALPLASQPHVQFMDDQGVGSSYIPIHYTAALNSSFSPCCMTPAWTFNNLWSLIMSVLTFEHAHLASDNQSINQSLF